MCFARKIIISNHGFVLVQQAFGGSCGVHGSTSALQYVGMRVTAQTTAASATEAKSFGASTTLWWTNCNAALASSRAVLKNSSACMPTPGWQAGWEAWITPRIPFLHRTGALRILTRNSNFDINYINQTWYRCEKHNAHTIIWLNNYTRDKKHNEHNVCTKSVRKTHNCFRSRSNNK